MLIERDVRELSNVSSHLFPDRSTKWLIRQREHLEALVRMVGGEIADRDAKEHQDLLRILTKENTQNQEIVDMAESIIEISEQRGLQQGIQQGIEQGIQQGIEQGIEQGARQTSIENTLAILNTRFPDADLQTLTPALEAIDDINRLKQLNIKASIVDTFHAFKEQLQA